MIYDETNFTVCALHSGREGTRKNITGKAISSMISDYNCKIENLRLIIGPGICPFHYEVSQQLCDEFAGSFAQQGIPLPRIEGRQLDIQSSIMNQALHSGILPVNINFYNVCTYESLDYFSYRRDGSKNRQINIIGVCDE